MEVVHPKERRLFQEIGFSSLRGQGEPSSARNVLVDVDSRRVCPRCVRCSRYAATLADVCCSDALRYPRANNASDGRSSFAHAAPTDCHTGCAIRQQVGKCIMPVEGVFAKVIKGGVVRPGDEIEVGDGR